MINYIFKKLLNALLVFIGVVMVVFILFQGMGDPARMVVGQTGDQKTLENIRKDLHLDKPKWQQFFLYLNDVSPLSIYKRETIESKKLKGVFIGRETKIGVKVPYLRSSYQTKKDTTAVLMQALPGTIVLAVSAMLFATIVGVSLGVFSALYKNTFLDKTALISSIAGISAPSFFMAILIAYIFGLLLHHYTGLPLTGSLFTIDDVTGERHLALRNLVLPAITLGIRPLAIITQLTRSSMLDVLKQDYIRTAYAKGLNRRRIIVKHALKNALNPVISAITGWFAELLAGAFFVEYIFGWQGLGKITVDALEKLDYPVVMGSVLLSGFIFILINIISDIIYSILDPRIRTI